MAIKFHSPSNAICRLGLRLWTGDLLVRDFDLQANKLIHFAQGIHVKSLRLKINSLDLSSKESPFKRDGEFDLKQYSLNNDVATVRNNLWRLFQGLFHYGLRNPLLSLRRSLKNYTTR